jgi:DNA-binding transcriptional regulator GbsR (MarR family)
MGLLSSSQQEFILHWGEMSSRWGIKRSVAQIHALLYLSEEPLNAEQITERLDLARSNVSTSLRELQAWGVVRVVHRLGDRRDYFEAVADVWEMFLTILEQRKRREIDPTLDMLRQCLAGYGNSQRRDAFAQRRMEDMLEMLETLIAGYERMRRLSPSTQRKVLKMGDRLGRLLGEAGTFRKKSRALPQKKESS